VREARALAGIGGPVVRCVRSNLALVLVLVLGIERIEYAHAYEYG
jgi:hypothetical protein